MITQAELKELLKYNPETGVFTRLTNKGGKKAGTVAGYLGGRGYMEITANGKIYKSHRLAFIYMTGSAPDEVDHINHIRTDNRWSNLTRSTRIENSRNLSISKRNKSGFIGVCWCKALSKWQSTIMTHRKSKHLGYFHKLSDAVLARVNADKEYDYHPNHGNS
jgi:hypothetical protein